MKHFLFSSFFFLVMLSGKAQYFQRQQNFIFTTQMREEEYVHGIRTYQNYSSANPNNFFWMGVGTSYNSNPALLAPHNLTHRHRLTRFDRNGFQSGNRATEFGTAGTPTNSGWYNSYGTSVAEVANTTGTGGFISVGRVESNPLYANATVPGRADALFVVHAASGSAVASFRFDFKSQWDEATCVRQSTFVPNTWLVCGNSVDVSAPFGRVWVARVDIAGNILWSQVATFLNTAGNIRNAKVFSLCENPLTGFIYLAGTIDRGLAPSSNHGLISAFTSFGGTLWSMEYGSPNATKEEFHVIRNTFDNQIVVGGFSDFGNPGIFNTWMLKANAGGGPVLWSNLLVSSMAVGSIEQSKCFDLQERYSVANSAYEYYLGGPAYLSTGPVQHVFKTDVNGNALSNWHYNSMVNDNGFGLDVNDAGIASSKGVTLFTNITSTSPGAAMNSFILKSYFNGATCTNKCPAVTCPTLSYPCPFFPQVPMVNPGLLSFPVKRRSWNHSQQTLCNQASVACGSNARFSVLDDAEVFEESESVGSLKLYPNPSSGNLYLKMVVDQSETYSIEAISILGKRVILSNETMFQAGENEILIDVSGLPSGQYLLRLKGSERTISHRFVKTN